MSGGITEQFGHAHSLYIDQLARYGLVGFVLQFTALGIGLVITVRAAAKGKPGPLAILVAYLVTGVTEPRNSWIAPSATGFLVILTVLAAAELRESRTLTPLPDHDPEEEPSLTNTTGAEAKSGDEKSGSLG